MRTLRFQVASVHREGTRLFAGGRNCSDDLTLGDVVRAPGGDVRVEAIVTYRKSLNVLDRGLTGELELSGEGVGSIELGTELVGSVQTDLPKLEILGEGQLRSQEKPREMRDCPRCGLVSPARSVRCQCGFQFEVDDRAAVAREHGRWTRSARVHMFGGILLAAVGAGVTALGYLTTAEHGGGYVVWYGAIVVGTVLAIRSYWRIRAIKSLGRDSEAKKG